MHATWPRHELAASGGNVAASRSLGSRAKGLGSVDRETLDGVSLQRTALDRIGVLLSSGALPRSSCVTRRALDPGQTFAEQFGEQLESN
jgi:hypothetical protein